MAGSQAGREACRWNENIIKVGSTLCNNNCREKNENFCNTALGGGGKGAGGRAKTKREKQCQLWKIKFYAFLSSAPPSSSSTAVEAFSTQPLKHNNHDDGMLQDLKIKWIYDYVPFLWYCLLPLRGPGEVERKVPVLPYIRQAATVNF